MRCGTIADISWQVVVYNRVDCCSARLDNAVCVLRWSSRACEHAHGKGRPNHNAASVQDVKVDTQLCGTIGTAVPVNTVSCASKIGQVVTIQLQGTNFLTLCEVEVWGVLSSVSTPAPSSTPTYACTRPLSREYEGGWCDCRFCCRVPNPLTDCYTAEWTPSFDNEGWSACSAGYVMTKLRFNDLSGASAPALGNIEQVQCCRLPLATPAWPIQTTNVPNWWNWGTVLDAVNAWALCPTNEFIAGLNVRFPWRSRVAPSLASPGRLSVRSPGQRHGAASDAAPFRP